MIIITANTIKTNKILIPEEVVLISIPSLMFNKTIDGQSMFNFSYSAYLKSDFDINGYDANRFFITDLTFNTNVLISNTDELNSATLSNLFNFFDSIYLGKVLKTELGLTNADVTIV